MSYVVAYAAEHNAVVAPLALRPDNPRLLLAYGTLKEDQPVHGGAAVPAVRTLRRGLRVPGVLFDVGAYPAAVLDHGALRGEHPVTVTFVGDLVEIVLPGVVGGADGAAAAAAAGGDRAAGEDAACTLEARLAAYDAYEEDSYRRVAIPVEDPEYRSAWIYEWVEDTAGLAPIPSGVWTSRG